MPRRHGDAPRDLHTAARSYAHKRQSKPRPVLWIRRMLAMRRMKPLPLIPATRLRTRLRRVAE